MTIPRGGCRVYARTDMRDSMAKTCLRKRKHGTWLALSLSNGMAPTQILRRHYQEEELCKTKPIPGPLPCKTKPISGAWFNIVHPVVTLLGHRVGGTGKLVLPVGPRMSRSQRNRTVKQVWRCHPPRVLPCFEPCHFRRGQNGANCFSGNRLGGKVRMMRLQKQGNLPAGLALTQGPGKSLSLHEGAV